MTFSTLVQTHLVILVIILQQEFPGFFVERRIRTGVDEKAFDGLPWWGRAWTNSATKGEKRSVSTVRDIDQRDQKEMQEAGVEKGESQRSTPERTTFFLRNPAFIDEFLSKTHHQDMPNAILSLPTLFQSVDANLTGFRDVGVKDFGEHGACVCARAWPTDMAVEHRCRGRQFCVYQ